VVRGKTEIMSALSSTQTSEGGSRTPIGGTGSTPFDAARRAELRAFLFSRRARVEPESIGKPRGVRRTPGLRREEVAELAGVSVEWYVMLETGRARNVSPRTLFAVARALRLDEFETTHLFALLDVARPPSSESSTEHEVPRWARLIVEGFAGGPAMLTDARYDVLVANELARTLLDFDLDPARPRHLRNALLRFFTDPGRLRLWRNRSEIGQALAADFRHVYGTHAHDADIASLLQELLANGEFADYWNDIEVRPQLGARGELIAPDGSHRTLLFSSVPVPGTTELRFAFLAFADGASADGARRL
jgi:transcriptional regulator with XRE-family HTH domain